MKNKFFTSFLAILASCTISLAGNGTFSGGNLTWDLTNGVLTIRGSGEMASCFTIDCPWSSSRSLITSVIIGDSVTSIGTSAFVYCSNLTSVQLGANITHIDTYAFEECTSLTSITFPNSLVSIGDNAFKNCSSLTSISIPNSVTSIGKNSFARCSNINTLSIPNSVTSIGENAFSNCTGLTDVVIGNSVTSIGESAFTNCKKITSLKIGDNVTSIGEGAFSFCDSLKSVIIPDKVTHIGKHAFYSCKKLSNITIGGSVYYIGYEAFYKTPYDAQLRAQNGLVYVGNVVYYFNENNLGTSHITIREGTKGIAPYAFKNCSTLVSVSFPNSLISISSNAFKNCSSLTELTIPENVKEAFGAFVDCSALTTVHWNATNCFDGEYFAGNPMYGISASSSSPFQNCPNVTSITFGENVEHIPGYLCALMERIDSIYIPSGVKSIGNAAFQQCISLRKINLPDSLTRISNNLFYGCSSLERITIPDNVNKIGNYAFYECSSLHGNIIIPDKVDSIGSYVFTKYSCDTIVIGKEVKYIDSYAFNNGTEEIMIFNAKNCSVRSNSWNVSTYNQFVIGEGVEEIPSNFLWSYKLTDIILPNSVKRIGTEAFYNSKVLNHIKLSDSLTYIGSGAFRNCTQLDSVVLPNTLTFIGINAFRGTKNLKSITIPSSVRTLQGTPTSEVQGIFQGSGLKEVTINANCIIPEWMFFECDSLRKISIGPLVQGVAGAFAFCPNIDTIIYDAVYIPDLQNPSFGSSVKSFTFGRNVLYIPANLCKGMQFITKMVIPENIVAIGSNAFANCANLDSIQWNAANCENFASEETSPFYASRQNIKHISFGSEVRNIPAYLCSGMRFITGLQIPEGTTTIGSSAFENCYSLDSVILPSSLEYIGNWAFMNTSVLSKVTCYATTPPNCNSAIFSNYNATLHVPCQARQTYMNHTEWSKFSTINCVDDVLYTVIFKDWDNSILNEQQVSYGEAAIAPETPMRDGYTFIGWDVDFSNIQSDLIVTALYVEDVPEYKFYTIKFINWDNEVLQNSQVLEGTIPIYIESEPSRPNDEQYSYTFIGWTPQIVAAVADANYFAIYMAKSIKEGLENVSDTISSSKIIHDGQILIIRGDKTYTVTGLEIR